MKSKDWVGLIEAGYSLEGNEETWLKQVLDQATPLFDGGFWPMIWTHSFTPTTVQIGPVVTRGPKKTKALLNGTLKAPPEAVDYYYRQSTPIGTFGESFEKWPELPLLMRQESGGVIRDAVAIKALTGQGTALGMGNLYLKMVSLSALDRKRWSLMCSHLGAGLRLRTLADSLSIDTNRVEGIFDAGGKVYEARDQLMDNPIREVLQETVRRIDRLRTRAGRRDPDAAMDAWEGLVNGRWSLVDYFDSDQRRFVVAIKNDPTCPDPRGLTERERQVAEFIGLGQSTKEISYTLGISQSAVTNCTARAQQKLSLSSLAELAAFFSPSGLRTKLAEVSVKGEELLVGSYPLINEDRVKVLTGAERAVLAQLIAGSTNNDIALRRHTSEHTVANQVKAIFHKLGVNSRSELAARLQSVA